MSSPTRKAQRRYPTLRAWRDASGFTLQEAADSLGLPLTTYWRYEQGVRQPRRDMTRHIMVSTGVSIEFLAGVA